MNTFKRKALASAVLGTLGVAGSAHAIYQDPNNLGQALIYPYYTVNSTAGNSWNTYISVTNTTTDVKVVKVRFREGKASTEALDFNLYLSPNDMWTGAVVPATSDAASPAHLVTNDVSCTNPPIPLGGVDFRNFAYTGTFADPLPATLDRTREGYVEMFEMGVLPQPGTLASAAIHSATTGLPSCVGLTGPNLIGTVGASLVAPSGGLFGTGTLINVNSGRDTMYNANAFGAYLAGPFYTEAGSLLPNFTQTAPAIAIVVTPPRVYVATFLTVNIAGAGARAASATMMHSDVINEYILDSTTRSNTDWVMTFPTKNLFVSATTVTAPFSNLLTSSGACETIGLTFFNREERSAGASGVDFSPTPPGAAANSLCWESTVLSFRNGSTSSPSSPAVPSLVLGSQNVTSVGVSSTFQNGWADVFFAGANAASPGLTSDLGSTARNVATGVLATGPVTFSGLPVVGFMIRTFDNGNLTCGTATCQGSYGGSAGHAFRNIISPTP